MDLSKAFDCLNRKLLISKLSAYGFSRNALRLIHSYLSERKQHCKILNAYFEKKKLVLRKKFSFQEKLSPPVCKKIFLA